MRVCESAAAGVYVHMPFCRNKCHYCAFNSYPVAGGVPEAYVNALICDLGSEACLWRERKFGSVYFGGGTPCLLSPSQLERVIGELRCQLVIAPGAEVTMECNPDSVSRAGISALKDLGINRISLGVQSLCQDELHLLGRAHDVRDAEAALGTVKDLCFASLSADIMIGIPGQNRVTLEGTLDGILPHADHVSAYLLSVEPATGLEAMVRAGRVALPPEEDVLALYGRADRMIRDWGLGRYEISNWSLPGHECVHNKVYWSRGDYAGFGAGAHSHRAGLRYWKVANPDEYVHRLSAGLDPIERREMLTKGQMLLEDIMLGLRTGTGVDLDHLFAQYEIDSVGLMGTVNDVLEAGLAIRNGSNVQLSASGIEVCDAVAEALARAACPRKIS